MYDVKAEKNPASLCLAARSITCEGLCTGMGESERRSSSAEKNGGMSELTKRLSHMRMIWTATVSDSQNLEVPGGLAYVLPALLDDMLGSSNHAEENQQS